MGKHSHPPKNWSSCPKMNNLSAYLKSLNFHINHANRYFSCDRTANFIWGQLIYGNLATWPFTTDNKSVNGWQSSTKIYAKSWGDIQGNFGVKLNVLQNSYHGVYIFFDFDPQNSKFRFFKNNCLKIRNFQVIQKRGYMLSRYIQKTCIQNINAISLFLAVQCPPPKKKQVKVMTSYF